MFFTRGPPCFGPVSSQTIQIDAPNAQECHTFCFCKTTRHFRPSVISVRHQALVRPGVGTEWAHMSVTQISIQMLCDVPHLVDTVGEMRWREWGHEPEPENREWWVNVTAEEAGGDRIDLQRPAN